MLRKLFGLFDSEKFVEVRQDGATTIYLTEDDLAAETKYASTEHGDLESNPRLSEIREKAFGQGTGFETPNLTTEEKDVLCRIGKSTSGQQVIDQYKKAHAEIKPLLDRGAAFIAEDLAVIENIMGKLPQLLDSLVEKGAIVENPELQAVPRGNRF